MKTIKLFTLLFTLLCMADANAVTAEKILANAARKYAEAGSVSATYTFSNKAGGRSRGSIYVKGMKYMIDTPQVSVCYDGTNQWEYVKGTNECTVTAPTFQATAQLNPYAVLTTYKSSYRAATVKSSIKGTYAVRLTPLSSHSPIARATMYIKASDWQPVRLDILDRGGTLTTIVITGIKTGTVIPDSRFVFDKKKHPGVEIIDLR